MGVDNVVMEQRWLLLGKMSNTFEIFSVIIQQLAQTLKRQLLKSRLVPTLEGNWNLSQATVNITRN